MRVKKLLVLCVSAVLAGSMLLAGCSKKEESKTDESLQYVKDNKELILGLDASFPPMGFTDKDQIKITADQLGFQRPGTAGKDHRLYLERTDIQQRQGIRDALF